MTVLYILLGVVGGFFVLVIGLRVLMAFRASRLKGRPAPELVGKVGKHLKSGKPALFYFYSPSCGACAAMTPLVKRMEKDCRGVFPVDISRDMDTARKFGVMATPTTIAVNSGIVEQVLIGPQPAGVVETLVPC